MATLSAPGIGSSLDVNGIVEKLMAVERMPVDALNRREASFQAKVSAYGSLKGALAALQTNVQSLASPSRFLAYSAAVGDSTLANASVGNAPALGSYSLEVTQLAQAQKLKSEPLAASTTTVGSGTITIDFGSYESGSFATNAASTPMTISIAPGQDSLSAVRDAINAANGGATASLVNDGTGTRLVISSKSTGESNALRITVADDDGTNADAAGLSQLQYDAGGVSRMTETIAAQDAAIVLDGIDIRSATNTLSGVLDGVNLTLTKADPGRTTTLTIGRDTAGAKSAIEGFVKAWNDVSKTIKSLSQYDAATKKGSLLTGDTTLQSVQSRLRNVLNATLGAGGVGSLADIGVATQRDGTLTLDTAKLAGVLSDPTKDVGALFASSTVASDSLVKPGTTADSVEAGNYQLSISRLASQGFATGSLAAVTTITAGVNDSLSLTVDGISATVTLAAGSYTADSLAAEIRTRVNGHGGLHDAGASILVSQLGGVLTMTSNRYGSASTVAITGGSASADLFGTAASTAGEDVEGLIAGVVATGTGRRLSALGISADIEGGVVGERGVLQVKRGVAAKLDDMIKAMLADDGLLAARTDSFDASIKDIGKRRETLNLRIEQAEKRYRAQFNALDASLARMQSTSNWLTTQLANLPKSQ